MKLFFENLLPFEVILFLLGVFLFLILCGNLIYSIVKKEEIKKLVYIFIIPIIMIAYPSIQEIDVDENKGVMHNKTKEVLINPNNRIAVKELKTATLKIENRTRSIKDLTAVSNSYYVLGRHDKAILYADKALDLKEKNNSIQLIEDKLTRKTNLKSISKKEYQKNDSLDNFELIKLQNIKAISKIELSIKNDPTLIKDTVRLSQQFKHIKDIENSTNFNYFKKQQFISNISRKVAMNN